MNNNFRDYSTYADAITVLKNPHKGFYYHYVDNGFQRPVYRNCIESRSDLLDFPGMNYIYIRFDWGDIEKEKGVYTWDPIEDIMNMWPELKFSFRICTFETGIYNKEPAVPKWLCETEGVCEKMISYYKKPDPSTDTSKNNGYWLGDSKGAAVYHPKEGEDLEIREFFEPYYDHPVYLEALEKFLKAFGERYDKDSRVESVDIGTFGRWGEGHSQTTKVSYDVLKKHIDMHLKYLPNKNLILNERYVNHLKNINAEDGKALEDYCYYHGLGGRDDGICVEDWTRNKNYSTIRNLRFFNRMSENAPIDMELAHFYTIRDEYLRDGLPYMEAIRDTHATYTGIHGSAREWLDKHLPITEYIANRIGYWYFIDGAEFMDTYSGAKAVMKLHVTNKGFARAYHQYDIKVTARKDGQSYILNEDSPDNRKWLSNESHVETIKLNFAGVPQGEYDLAIGMYEGDTAIKLALDDKLVNTDGSYTLDKITVL